MTSTLIADPAWDRTIAGLVVWLRKNRMQAHTYAKGGSLILKPRRPKRSRLNGQPR